MVIRDNEDGGGNGKDDKVLGNMPRDVGKTFTIYVRKGVKKDTKGCLQACLLITLKKKKKKKTLGKVPKDFGKNKMKYQTVPTTSRRMLGKNRCVKKNKGMPRSMLKVVEFFFLNYFFLFFKQK